MNIYVKFDKPETIKEFLILLFSNHTGAYYTNVETYSNIECTEIQCLAGRYRSFDEVLDCVNTYFPETTPKILMHELLMLEISSHFCLYTMYCRDICKSVILFIYGNKHSTHEERKEKCNFSWKELYNELGLTTEQDVVAYIKKHKQIKELVTI